jgi:hypothetical protein
MRHSYEEARPSGLPRVDGPMVVVDGRRVRVAERGPHDGTPGVFFHGSPGSRWVGNFRIGDFALEHRIIAVVERGGRRDARLPER